MSTDVPDEFAHSTWVHEGRQCPVKETRLRECSYASIDPKYEEIALEYDAYASYYTDHEFLIDADDAQRAWWDMVEGYIDDIESATSGSPLRSASLSCLEFATEIADELGWTMPDSIATRYEDVVEDDSGGSDQ